MGRVYAGVMGPLACTTVVIRGLVHGGNPDATLTAACLCLFAFAAIGGLVGWVAGLIVDDAVRGRLRAAR